MSVKVDMNSILCMFDQHTHACFTLLSGTHSEIITSEGVLTLTDDATSVDKKTMSDVLEFIQFNFDRSPFEVKTDLGTATFEVVGEEELILVDVEPLQPFYENSMQLHAFLFFLATDELPQLPYRTFTKPLSVLVDIVRSFNHDHATELAPHILRERYLRRLHQLDEQLQQQLLDFVLSYHTTIGINTEKLKADIDAYEYETVKGQISLINRELSSFEDMSYIELMTVINGLLEVIDEPDLIIQLQLLRYWESYKSYDANNEELKIVEPQIAYIMESRDEIPEIPEIVQVQGLDEQVNMDRHLQKMLTRAKYIEISDHEKFLVDLKTVELPSPPLTVDDERILEKLDELINKDLKSIQSIDDSHQTVDRIIELFAYFMEKYPDQHILLLEPYKKFIFWNVLISYNNDKYQSEVAEFILHVRSFLTSLEDHLLENYRELERKFMVASLSETNNLYSPHPYTLYFTDILVIIFNVKYDMPGNQLVYVGDHFLQQYIDTINLSDDANTGDMGTFDIIIDRSLLVFERSLLETKKAATLINLFSGLNLFDTDSVDHYIKLIVFVTKSISHSISYKLPLLKNLSKNLMDTTQEYRLDQLREEVMTYLSVLKEMPELIKRQSYTGFIGLLMSYDIFDPELVKGWLRYSTEDARKILVKDLVLQLYVDELDLRYMDLLGDISQFSEDVLFHNQATRATNPDARSFYSDILGIFQQYPGVNDEIDEMLLEFVDKYHQVEGSLLGPHGGDLIYNTILTFGSDVLVSRIDDLNIVKKIDEKWEKEEETETAVQLSKITIQKIREYTSE